jgi:ribosome-associated translation inhibitor RaiA
MNGTATRPLPNIQVQTQGEMPRDSADRARAKVLALVNQVREPVLFARVKLTWRANQAMERRALAQANLDVNGRLARASVAAETMSKAIDLLQDRLSRRMDRLNEHWEARRGKMAQANEWRHYSEPTDRPDYYPRPVEERLVVRHKSFSLAWETPDEAVFEMESMDYGFHLFTDADSGEDSVVYRDEEGGYRLAQVHPRPELLGPVAVSLTMSEQPAPRLSVADAQRRLDGTGFPFVFFADETTGRGNVMYHRYDGHYGLITPVE